MGEGCDPPADGWPTGPGPPCRPPPLGRQEAALGDQRAPPTAPPPSHSGPRADGGRPKKRRPRTPPKEAAAPGVRGHHGRGRRPHALPAAGRRQTGGAQDGANGAALSEAGPGKTGARTRAGGPPPPPPPPPRRTDPLAADQAAPDARGRPATPTARLYPGGGTPETTDGGPTPDGAGGRGGGPPTPPPAPPPGLGTTGATLRPPGAGGAPPLPPSPVHVDWGLLARATRFATHSPTLGTGFIADGTPKSRKRLPRPSSESVGLQSSSAGVGSQALVLLGSLHVELSSWRRGNHPPLQQLTAPPIPVDRVEVSFVLPPTLEKQNTWEPPTPAAVRTVTCTRTGRREASSGIRRDRWESTDHGVRTSSFAARAGCATSRAAAF